MSTHPYQVPSNDVPLDRRRLELLQQCSIHSQALIQTDCQCPDWELFGSSPRIQDTSFPEDDNAARALVPPTNGWRYPNFESIVGAIRNHVTMDRSSLKPEQNAEVYILEEGFLPQDRSWIQFMRESRMTRDSKVLYRPQIVNDLVQRIEEILASKQRVGLLVKGPQGVGKSYSLINLTRYLMTSGNYWVTIIPDCEYWDDELNFFTFLLQSVGVDPDLFDLDYDARIDPDFALLIDDIDTVLSAHGMEWVFIFDQIERIFTRAQFRSTKDVGTLPFPFTMMRKVQQPGRIISILSVSGNHDVSQPENHAGFDVLEHPTQFNRDEIMLLYPEKKIATRDWETVEHATGLVPWYLHRWFLDPHRYFADVSNEIEYSLDMLKIEKQGNKNIWNNYVESAIQCLLAYSTTDRPVHWDRKFSLVQESSDKPQTYKIVSLFPCVNKEYRKCFSDDLFTYIRKRDQEVLVFCRGDKTTEDSRGRCFEELVITRFVTDGLSPTDFRKLLAGTNIRINKQWMADLQQPADKIEIYDAAFPRGPYMKNHPTFFIPVTPNVHAVDLIIRIRKIVIAIQIRTSSKDHGEVVQKVMSSIRNARWKKNEVEKVILVYLSPKRATQQQMAKQIGGQSAPSEGGVLVTRCCYIKDFESLKNLQWDL